MKNVIVFIEIGTMVGFGVLLNYVHDKAYDVGISTGRSLGYIEGYLKCVADGKSDEESSASKS